MLEDAFLLGDGFAVAGLFEDAGVAASVDLGRDAHGRAEIAAFTAELRRRGRTFVARPARVVQQHDTALVISDGSTSVARRDPGGVWRYVICFLHGGG